MTTERRLQRMREVLDQRIGWVRCAIEAVYHRHNLSAILRTCDALGIQEIHLVGSEDAGAHPSAPSKGPARGAERWLTLHEHSDPDSAIAALRAKGFRIYVADLQGRAVLPEEIPLDHPVALWFGAELLGVSEIARQAADGVVCVPMRGMAQSLNVSVAAALALRPVAERARSLGPHSALDEGAKRELLAGWLARERVFLDAVRQRTSPEDGER